MINTNPFNSTTFLSFWSKHFLGDKKANTFSFAKNLSFYESKIPGLHINAGKNLTKGVHYEFNPNCGKEEKGKTFLIYDVIDFAASKENIKNSPLGLYSVKQYPGFLIELGNFSSLDDYMSKTFKKSSRYKLRKYKKRLEESFHISFKAHCGEMSKEEYDAIFDSFRNLLEKRFGEKQISNNNLDPEEWNFYKDVAYPMILEKKAVLFVLYNNNEPISVTLGYLSDKRIFDAITVFDIDYAKFHLGSIKIMNLIDWCTKNGWDILDFSKGYFDYKTRWSNKKFHFHYHIVYDKSSFKSRVLAYTLKSLFSLKQYLREKKLNETLHRFTYALKNKKKESLDYQFLEVDDRHTQKELAPLDLSLSEHSSLKGICYEFLYLHQEHLENLNVFKMDETNESFLLVGQDKKMGVKLNV
ncbi:GNAT family N-acetyltransferase [Flagellimonas sp.]|uniref:GNAT family N-acetyltransferase n=1 Tax=Flagellimonas sp. TaxID=2058762 RepID=UPI003BAED859